MLDAFYSFCHAFLKPQTIKWEQVNGKSKRKKIWQQFVSLDSIISITCSNFQWFVDQQNQVDCEMFQEMQSWRNLYMPINLHFSSTSNSKQTKSYSSFIFLIILLQNKVLITSMFYIPIYMHFSYTANELYKHIYVWLFTWVMQLFTSSKVNNFS